MYNRNSMVVVVGGGAGVVDGDSSERCLSGVVGVIEESLLKQFKRRVGKGINCL